MNPEIRTEWTSRLRDGKREQGRGYLKTEGKYCCLGVLCEMAAEAGVVEERAITTVRGGKVVDGSEYHGLMSTLPESVQKWAGVPENFGGLGYLDNDACGRSLADLNDDGKTFPEIADIIEERF